jgi:hypothetical protein
MEKPAGQARQLNQLEVKMLHHLVLLLLLMVIFDLKVKIVIRKR